MNLPTALVTGATGDIGKAIASRLAQDGFQLALFGREQSKLSSAAHDLALSTTVDSALRTVVCDVRRADDVSRAVDELARQIDTVEVLVNCAGVSGGGITADVAPAAWDDVIATNLNGTFYVVRELLTRKLIPHGGRIINIASTGGKQGVLHGSPYSASKHGVVGFTKSLGLELAREGSGITVNAVCPGFVESAMAEKVRQNYARLWNTDTATAKTRVEERVPIGRYIEPDEVAGMVSYLASPEASAVTAQALNICGGLGNV